MTTLIAASPAVAGPMEDVDAATQAWVAAYNSRDPKQIVARYAADRP